MWVLDPKLKWKTSGAFDLQWAQWFYACSTATAHHCLCALLPTWYGLTIINGYWKIVLLWSLRWSAIFAPSGVRWYQPVLRQHQLTDIRMHGGRRWEAEDGLDSLVEVIGRLWLRTRSIDLDRVHAIWKLLVSSISKDWCDPASIWAKLGWLGSRLIFLPFNGKYRTCTNISIHILLEVSKNTWVSDKGVYWVYPQNSNSNAGKRWWKHWIWG